MTDFSYCSTDLITGELLADSIPLTVQSFTQSLNGGGSLTGSLALDEVDAVNQPFIEALDCGRAVLWVLADNFPVWNGIAWDWVDTGRTTGTLPVSAQTLDSIFTKRVISADLAYENVDIFGVFIDLVQYGCSKSSPYINFTSPFTGPASPLVAQQAAVANLIVPTGPAAVAGFPWTAEYAYSDFAQVASAFGDLVTGGNVEYVFQPGLNGAGQLATYLFLAYDTGLGRAFPESGYAITYPGSASDYAFPVTRSQGANYLWATAAPNGDASAWLSAYPHGADLADLQAGYPLMEDTVSWAASTVTSQAQINAYADGQVNIRTRGMTNPLITVPGSSLPRLTDLVLGDQFPFAATSRLHPAGPGGQPGYQGDVRLVSWQCFPSGPDQPETIALQTSAVGVQ